MRLIAKILRKIYRAFHPCPIYNHITIPDEKVSDYLIHQIESNQPFCAARFGSTEFCAMQALYFDNESQLDSLKQYVYGYLENYGHNTSLIKESLQNMCFYSGFFPNEMKIFTAFYQEMLGAVSNIDLLGVWLKEDLFEKDMKKTQFCNLGALEPYDYAEPWTKALEGKRVLVIHPFAKTIEAQYARRELLWRNKDVLPEFELKTIKAVQTIAGEKPEFDTWFDALHHMEQQMDAIDYDIAIIGCGAYGMPLTAYAKRMGKKAVHLGGATQILFGIKGKRWDDNPAVSKFYNEYWVRPLPEETPKQSKKVENGCYW